MRSRLSAASSTTEDPVNRFFQLDGALLTQNLSNLSDTCLAMFAETLTIRLHSRRVNDLARKGIDSGFQESGIDAISSERHKTRKEETEGGSFNWQRMMAWEQ